MAIPRIFAYAAVKLTHEVSRPSTPPYRVAPSRLWYGRSITPPPMAAQRVQMAIQRPLKGLQAKL